MANKKLSERQHNMLVMVRDYVEEHERPPTIREIGDDVGISSTSVVSYNLGILERRGYIAREPDVSRGLRLTQKAEREIWSKSGEGVKPETTEREIRGRTVSVPLLGVIGAGLHVPPRDNDWLEPALGYVSVPPSMVRGMDRVYAVKVQGDSMIEDLIADGDIVILRYQETAENGDTVAAWLKDDEIMTLKEFHLEEDRRRVRLQPRNPMMEPIYADPDSVEIQGKIIGLIRQLE